MWKKPLPDLWGWLVNCLNKERKEALLRGVSFLFCEIAGIDEGAKEMSIKRFNENTYTWETVETLVYKEDNSPFKDVTRQILFDGAFDLPCQLRYFEVGVDGYSTLEHHEHTHLVIIFRGRGQCLLGTEIKDVKVGDVLVVPSHLLHQFRANQGEPLGFLCFVNQNRDKVQLPTKEEINRLFIDEQVRTFLEK